MSEYSDIKSNGGLDPRTKYEADRFKRQWVGLTDDEVYNALPGYPIDYKLEFYRAIEAKLKEKNG